MFFALEPDELYQTATVIAVSVKDLPSTGTFQCLRSQFFMDIMLYMMKSALCIYLSNTSSMASFYCVSTCLYACMLVSNDENYVMATD